MQTVRDRLLVAHGLSLDDFDDERANFVSGRFELLWQGVASSAGAVGNTPSPTPPKSSDILGLLLGGLGLVAPPDTPAHAHREPPALVAEVRFRGGACSVSPWILKTRLFRSSLI